MNIENAQRPATSAPVHEACEALAKGPMEQEEIAWRRRVGDHVQQVSQLRRSVTSA